MFNKSIVVALIVCACYLGTIEARPGGIGDLIGGGGGPLDAVGPVLTGAAAGASSAAAPALVGSVAKPVAGLPVVSSLPGLSG
ncbi:uncharacterized protein LOC108045321 [Drosophila rhopaloa]|uniref:Uncharacterized protein LOC108045321 n=1 Tax=Drosophila rhopaloa TaxID=1041015 RepID=A0A6P4EPJ1_DRORH|nr:uncharacterized protein LOC108045321 [Drosophila rhopaloa]